ncbi:ATPase [Vibrio phage VB_VaC_TDDLMA]
MNPNQNLVITHNPDMYQMEDAISAFRDTQDGFCYPTPDLSLIRSELDKFIKDVEKEVCALQVYKFNKSKQSIYEKYMGDEVRIYTQGNSKDTYSTVVAKSEEVAEKVFSIYLRYIERTDDVTIYMRSFFMNDGRLDMTESELKAKDLEYISELYYPYIKTDVMFEQFFTGAENIMLLVGAPGLGKSKLTTLALKHAHENPDILPYDKMADNETLESQFINCGYVKSTDVLVNDKFWRELEQGSFDFCIIDDLDYMLTKRDAEVQTVEDDKKNTFLNQFLSYTDGIEKHNTKFIITTNQTYDDIDSALLRDGRLFDILEFRPLHKEEALKIWSSNNLDEKDFHSVFTKDEVSPATLGKEINKRLNKRIDSATQSYLLEDNISKVKSAGRRKRMSL